MVLRKRALRARKSSANTFQFQLLWLILRALVSIKELEGNQENYSSNVMAAFCLVTCHSFSFPLYKLPFYTVFRNRAIANITEANFIIQIPQI